MLTDPQKREIYNKYGEEGLKQGGGGGPGMGRNADDLFREVGGSADNALERWVGVQTAFLREAV